MEIATRGLQIGEKLRRSSRHDKPSFQVNYVLDSDEDCGGDECDDNALVGRGHISVTQTAVEEEVDGKYFMKGKYVNQIFFCQSCESSSSQCSLSLLSHFRPSKMKTTTTNNNNNSDASLPTQVRFMCASFR